MNMKENRTRYLYVVCTALLVTVCSGGCAMDSEEDSVSKGDRFPADLLQGDISEYSSEEVVELLGLDIEITKGVCPQSYTCPSSYGSCAGWSAYENCDGVTCDLYDEDCAIFYDDPDPIHGGVRYYGKKKQPQYRYQVCHNIYGDTCTNVENRIYHKCRC
jgi:hypothetical protein